MHRLMFASALILPFCLSGCGPDKPVTTQVTGKVTLNGQPIGSGTVSFSPIDTPGRTLIRPGTGNLQPDGTYTMASFGPDDGVLAGEYTVSIVSYEVPPGPENPGGGIANVPRKYLDPQTSGLKVTIPDNSTGKLEFNFELEGEKNK